MPDTLICAGVLLLVLSAMAVRLRHIRHLSSPARQKLYMRGLITRTVRRIGAKALQERHLPLSTLRDELGHLRRQADVLAFLPAGTGCAPRILNLAHTLAENGVPSVETMVDALKDEQSHYTAEEIAALPLAQAFSLARRMQDMLERKSESESDELLWQYATWFSKLREMDWLAQGEAVDTLHPLLLREPSGTYARMTAASRLALRIDAERFAKHARSSPADIAVHVLELCHTAGPQASEAYAGYWLQTAEGMLQLHRSLGKRAGWLYARLAPRTELRRYALRCIMGSVAGFVFLQSGQPVFMLPFFCICAGTMMRRIPAAHAQRQLPAVHTAPAETAARTLVALPVMLRGPGDVHKQIGRLEKIRQILGHADADFILMADVPAHITSVSAQDGLIAQAALDALANAGDSRMMYLQRSRSWHNAAHIYQCRGGYGGAVQALCEAIVHGECTDPLFCTSVDPALLERRYAYMLTLPEDTLPTSELLTTLQGVLMHPLNARFPTQNGWQGYSLVTPGDRDPADGCWLLRPDAFLEATAGFLKETGDERLLCCELAGHGTVDKAHAERIARQDALETLRQRAATDQRLLAWQLPWVRTPSGIVPNPLNHLSRFRLRDRFREDVLPIAQAILLLWSLLTGSWTLLALSLLVLPPRCESYLAWADNLLSLPTRAAVSVTGLLSSWLSKRNRLPARDVLELWAQWIAAAILIGLAIALPGMRTVSMLLAASFAAAPFLRRSKG